jgi:sirohydrochlorin cobaltochelatase
VTRVVLVGGHESDGGADLVRYEELVPRTVAVRPGRWLHDVAMAALDAGETVVAVPMTFGRDPTMVADTARTLRWVTERWGGAVALAAPFGVADHLTARLRAAAGAVHARDPGAALVVSARAGDPFDDAELHRIAHLVRVHGAGVEVAVATIDRDAAVAGVLDRLRRLGFDRSVVVPAGFAAGLDVDPADPACTGMAHAGPLMGDGAVARIVTERVDAALHDLQQGRDGIAAGLGADHDHGYAHSHPGPEPHPHPHDHQSHPHSHDPQGRNRWPAGSPRTTTAPTTSRSTPVAPR